MFPPTPPIGGGVSPSIFGWVFEICRTPSIFPSFFRFYITNESKGWGLQTFFIYNCEVVS